MTPAALAATHAAAFAPERGWSAEEMAALLSDRGAVVAGEPDAFVLGRVTLDEAEILTVATRPALRRQGHAARALAAFERAAWQAGAVVIFLEVAADNAPAQALYAAAGYVPAGRRKGYYARATGPRVDALILRKSMTQG